MPVILESMEQGSPAWFKARVGCITMSNAGLLLAGGKGLTRLGYILDVASELSSGQLADRPKTYDMQKGNLTEPYAVDAYELYTGHKVQRVGLGYLNEDKRIAASPDGLVGDKGVEIKCPNPKGHLRTIIEEKVPVKKMPQVQGNMWVFGLQQWDFVSFCPHFKPMPIFIITVERDEEMVTAISQAAIKAVGEVDDYVNKAKSEVSKEMSDLCSEAIQEINDYFNIEPEVF